MCFIFVEILGFYMFMVKRCIYMCMYLLQVVSSPPQLGIESDLFQCVQLAKEVKYEPACHLKRCGSTFLCITSAIRVEAAGLDRTYPKWARSQTRVSCRPSCALGLGIQRIKRLEHVLYIC